MHIHTGRLGCIIAEADGSGGDDGIVHEVDEGLFRAVVGVVCEVVLCVLVADLRRTNRCYEGVMPESTENVAIKATWWRV